MGRDSREDTAYVLHRHAWKESSYILRVFGRAQGKFSLVARGVRGGRGRHAVLPGQPCLLEWQPGRELGRLLSLQTQGPPLAPLQGEAWWAAQYLAELLLHALREDEPAPELFDLYGLCLQALREAQTGVAVPLRLFEWGLLQALGLAADLARDSGGARLQPEHCYRLVADEGLRPDAVQGLPGAQWQALAAGRVDAALAQALRRPLQAQLAAVVPFERLHSRREWQVARALARAHAGEGGAGDVD